MIHFAAGASSDVGQVRQANQDQAHIGDRIFAVADGMGGHTGGEVAAEVAVAELALVQQLDSLDDLVSAVHQANDRVVERSRDDPALRGMGTTLTVLGALGTALDPRLGVANVGDSRLYLFRDDELVQLTEDHSLVEALVRDGRLTRDEAAAHPQRNILTRALGIDDKVLVDAWELMAVEGDRYVICSDGLFNEVAADRIVELLDDNHEPTDAAAALVDEANGSGGRDNITVVVVDIVEAPPVEEPPDDRIVVARKAVPDATLRVEPPAAGDEAVPPADPHPDELPVDRTHGSGGVITWRLAVFIVAVLLVAGVLLTTLVVYARGGWYVGTEGEEVVIYRGREGGMLWFDPTVEEYVGITVDDLSESEFDVVTDGVSFDSLDDARDFAEGLTPSEPASDADADTDASTP